MNFHSRISLFSCLFAFFLLLGCSSSNLKTDSNYEKRDKDQIYKNGSVLSDEGGLAIFGGDNKKTPDGQGIGVNAYLWRATLETLAFMPIVTADPFGGVITTDWYSAAATPNERLKLNVFILDRELRADGVRVTVFRQTRAGNAWVDAPAAPSTGPSLEESILTRARQLRLAQREK